MFTTAKKGHGVRRILNSHHNPITSEQHIAQTLGRSLEEAGKWLAMSSISGVNNLKFDLFFRASIFGEDFRSNYLLPFGVTMAIRASQIGQICKRKRGYRYAYLRGLHLCNFQVMTTKYQNGSLNSCWFQVVVLRSLLDASVDHFRNVLGGILGRRRLTDSFFQFQTSLNIC